ncbi:unnamed protein product [marine sediment metagenome]|uniref:Uncharacterized protein n=1 Tax=marine sediment metagenome TaxID=412755 RepID=X1LE38_9ZZZZ
MKKFIISFAVILFFGSLMGANAFAADNEYESDSDPEFSPEAMTPPPAEAIDILVEAGYMTLAEKKIVWNAYDGGCSDGDCYASAFMTLSRVLWRVAGIASVIYFVYEAARAVGHWMEENMGSTGGYGCTVPSFTGGGNL